MLNNYICTIKDNKTEWKEELRLDDDDYQQSAQNIVDDFNKILRPGETPRILLSVGEIVEDKTYE